MNTVDRITQAISETKYELVDKLVISEEEKEIKSTYGWYDLVIWIDEINILFDLEVTYFVDQGSAFWCGIENHSVTVKEVQIDEISIKEKHNEWFFNRIKEALEDELENVTKFEWE